MTRNDKKLLLISLNMLMVIILHLRLLLLVYFTDLVRKCLSPLFFTVDFKAYTGVGHLNVSHNQSIRPLTCIQCKFFAVATLTWSYLSSNLVRL